MSYNEKKNAFGTDELAKVMTAGAIGKALIGGIVPFPIVGAVVGGFLGGELASRAIDSQKSNNDDVLNVKKAAQRLGLSEYTLKKKLRDGEIAGTKEGKSWAIPYKSIEAYSQKTGKSGIVLGDLESSRINIPYETPKSPQLLKDSIDRMDLGIKRIELSLAKLDLQASHSDMKDSTDIKSQRIDLELEKNELEQYRNDLLIELHKLEAQDEK